MEDIFSRTKMLIGEAALSKLSKIRIAIFGVGGVGGYVAEALCRSGVGDITLIDKDEVNITNINRQIIALHSTIGKSKVQVMADRISDINPLAKVTCHKEFYTPENSAFINLVDFDYVIDAIDNVTAKIHLAKECYQNDVKIISSMGTGNKLDVTKFKIVDIFETTICPLCRVVRNKLKKIEVKNLTVLYSTEQPIKVGQRAVGSISYVPPAAGLIIASYVIKDILQLKN